jgi:hypothetical protein
MGRHRLRDIVIVVPGITGSVLTRGGVPIWGPSYRLGAAFAAQPERTAARLLLPGPSEGTDDSVPILATALMPDIHMVAGLVKIDGYSRLQQAIRDTFEVVEATNGRGGNLIEFPYDWRLDNRINAQRLAAVVERALAAWRRYADVPDARVVLVVHSMGGLVARYYLEVLQGLRTCRALIAFGTPFRGSPKALGYLANGYKHLHVDLSAAIRSFPSVYQLLPIYPMLSVGGMWKRVTEVEGLPYIDPELAADALRFHREIEDAVAKNEAEHPGRYGLLPIVGTHQPTDQSATFDGVRITLSDALPEHVDPYFGSGDIDGDGTVPVSSAAPIDLSQVYSDVYQPERHSSLQASPTVLINLIGKLVKMQSANLRRLRGPDVHAVAAEAALTLAVDDAYRTGEDVVIVVRWRGGDRSRVVMMLKIAAIDGGTVRTVAMTPTEEGWQAKFAGLDGGVYRIAVAAEGRGSGGMPPVHDVFEVVGESP